MVHAEYQMKEVKTV